MSWQVQCLMEIADVSCAVAEHADGDIVVTRVLVTAQKPEAMGR
ncbi:hypothetical protein [Candidatus Villigracilis affinis]